MSNEFLQLIKNFVSLVTGKTFVRFVSFLSTLYMARELGPADFGQLSFALTVGFLFSSTVNLGLDNLIVREVARNRNDGGLFLGDALILKLSALPLGLLVAILLSLTDPSARGLFFFLIGYSALHSYLLIFCAVFRGLERMEFEALLLSVQILLIAAGSVVAVWLTGAVVLVAVVHFFATLGVLAWSYVLLLRKGLRPRYRWQPSAWRQLLLTVLPFGLIIVGLLIYDRQVVILITLLCGEAAAGWFNAVHGFILVLVNIPQILVNTLFPLLSRSAQGDRRSVVTISGMTLKYANAASFPAAIGLFALADPIINGLFGAQYSNSVALLRLIAPSLPFVFITVILVGVLQTVDQQRACAIGSWSSLAVAAPACLAATHLGGYQMGTLLYVLSHALLAGVLFWIVTRAVGSVDLGQVFVRPAAASIAMAAVFYLGRELSLPLVISAAILCYGVMLPLTGTVGKPEWALLRGALGGWRGPGKDEKAKLQESLLKGDG
jgi:O-antigen/teichoic acid export membrane protein